MYINKSSKPISIILCIIMALTVFTTSSSSAYASGETFLNTIDTDSVSINSYVTADTEFLSYLKDNYDNMDTFNIGTSGELSAIREMVNKENKDFSGKTIVLTNDIDLGGSGLTFSKEPVSVDNQYDFKTTGSVNNAWEPIGTETNYFSGTFNGNSYAIKNMTAIEKTSGDQNAIAGLFGIIFNGSAENLIIDSSCKVYAFSTGATANAGSIAGLAIGGSNISNCYNTGTIVSNSDGTYLSYAGGIVGDCDLDVISDCVNKGNVISKNNAGGIAGKSSSGNVMNCYNAGLIESSSHDNPVSGGISGNNSGIISNCCNSGKIMVSCRAPGSVYSPSTHAGGIAGSNVSKDSKIENCYNTGKIFSYSDKVSEAGGIAGYSDGSIVSNCYNVADVNAYSDTSYSYGGGIVGHDYMNKSSNCYNSGAVSASSTTTFAYPVAGGIVGFSYDGDISSCINISNIYSTSTFEDSYAGAIIGKIHDGAIGENCIFDSGNIISPTAIDGAQGTIFDGGDSIDDLESVFKNSGYKTYNEDLFTENNDVWKFESNEHPTFALKSFNIRGGEIKEKDGKLSIPVSFTPASTMSKGMTWSSSDTNIATVDSNGLVSAVSEGTTEIHAISTEYPALTQSAIIKVSYEQPATPSPTPLPTPLPEISGGDVPSQVVVKPQKISGLKVRKGKKSFTVSWKRNKSCSGYQIVYSTKKNFKSKLKYVNISKNNTVKKTVKNLKKEKTYYVKVRSFKKVGNKKIYGPYTKVKKVKLKK